MKLKWCWFRRSRSCAPPSALTGSYRPVIELHSSQPSPETYGCLRRILLDVKVLANLTEPQVRAIYKELECTRDLLSLILDKADGKLR
jgi:hypothetical protein